MRINLFLTIAASLALCSFVSAQDEDKDKDKDKHDHDHAVAGPNGGKVLHDIDPHAELFVTKERKLQITFLDDAGKPVPPAAQSITVTCGKRTAPTRMTFQKKDSSFLSDKPLPEGMKIPTVLQIKITPDAQNTTIRLNLNLEKCPTCEHLEYACTCDHAAEEKKDK